MEILRIVLFTLLTTIGLGIIVGIIAAKQAIRKAKNQRKPLLTATERAVYSALFVMGAVCIVVGSFWLPSLGSNTDAEYGMQDDGMIDMGMTMDPGDYSEDDIVMFEDHDIGEDIEDGGDLIIIDDEQNGEYVDSDEYDTAEDYEEASDVEIAENTTTVQQVQSSARSSGSSGNTRSSGGVAVAVQVR